MITFSNSWTPFRQIGRNGGNHNHRGDRIWLNPARRNENAYRCPTCGLVVRRVTAPAAQATIGHLKAIVVLAAACCVVLTVMPHPGRHATINQLHLVAACAVVSFYFGSRS